VRRAFIASVLLHGAILALAFFGLPFFETERPEPTIIPVEIVPEAELADITTPKPAEEPAPTPPEEPEETQAPPPEPEPEPTPPPPPPPPAEEAEAVPPLEEIKPEPKPKLEEKPVPPEPRPTASISPRTKPKPPKRFDTSQIAALLDKKDQPEPKPKAENSKLDLEKLAKELNPSTPSASKQQLATLEDMVESQLKKCWYLNPGMKNAEKQIVRVHILLRSDGSLIGAPEVLNKERYNDPDGAQFDVAARAAINAVYKCTPLRLPRELYNEWRDLTYNFDPSQMLDVN